MKRLIVFLAIITAPVVISAQDKDIVTEKYKVEGNCNMCKKRIENAAFVKGVKRAEWNKDTHELTLIYKPSKTSADEILKQVAAIGHSSEKVQTTDAAYKKLPDCCHYKTHVCND
jgi:mercuric ion binding protein